MTDLEIIQANAELVLKMIREYRPEATYDAASVEWLDGHITRIRDAERDPEMRERLIGMYGSFLGECIVRNYDGTWHEGDEGWSVAVGGAERIKTYPFNKVAKHFNGGEGDSIYSFFTVIPVPQKQPSRQVKIAGPAKRWWKFW